MSTKTHKFIEGEINKDVKWELGEKIKIRYCATVTEKLELKELSVTVASDGVKNAEMVGTNFNKFPMEYKTFLLIADKMECFDGKMNFPMKFPHWMGEAYGMAYWRVNSILNQERDEIFAREYSERLQEALDGVPQVLHRHIDEYFSSRIDDMRERISAMQDFSHDVGPGFQEMNEKHDALLRACQEVLHQISTDSDLDQVTGAYKYQALCKVLKEAIEK
jgi:hypothetical protein